MYYNFFGYFFNGNMEFEILWVILGREVDGYFLGFLGVCDEYNLVSMFALILKFIFGQYLYCIEKMLFWLNVQFYLFYHMELVSSSNFSEFILFLYLTDIYWYRYLSSNKFSIYFPICSEKGWIFAS
jgi:hypothetical protein